MEDVNNRYRHVLTINKYYDTNWHSFILIYQLIRKYKI